MLPLVIFSQTSAPDVIASGGDFFDTGTFSNSFTIGEMAEVETYSTTGFILTQGFQQPADFASGIADPQNAAPLFGVYPNPSNGIFFVEYALEDPAEVVVEIFDGLGQRVSTITSSHDPGTQQQQIDLTSFSSGIYSVRLTIQSQGNSESKTVRINLIR
jgi:hypothetical protein